jgi:hypothetical protein
MDITSQYKETDKGRTDVVNDLSGKIRASGQGVSFPSVQSIVCGLQDCEDRQVI